MADEENHVATKIHTNMQVGTLTMAFTAAAVINICEKREIDLTNNVSKRLKMGNDVSWLCSTILLSNDI